MCQRPILIREPRLEKLGGAANSRQRIFDFVRQHARHAGDGARRRAMRQLPLDHLRHRPLLQHQKHIARLFRQRTAVDIDELGAGKSRCRDLDAVFVDRRAGRLHLLDECEQRATESDDVGYVAARQRRGAHREEYFRGGVGENDGLVVADDENRMRQGAEQTLAINNSRRRRRGCRLICDLRVEVALLVMPPKAPGQNRTPRGPPSTRWGSNAVQSCARQDLTVAVSAPLDARYQPTCLRAFLRPRSRP